jgi:hypothetical protein
MSYAERRRFLWILFLIGIVLIAITASATTLTPLRLEDLAQQSKAVARLRCLSAKSFWEAGEIWTETKFAVVQQEKGALASIVTVRVLGGTVGNLHSRVDEAPAFRPGEEVYLFLWNRGEQTYRVLGWSQGTFRVTRDTQTGTETVTQDSSAGTTFDPQTHAFQRIGIRKMSVTMFRARLRDALRKESR